MSESVFGDLSAAQVQGQQAISKHQGQDNPYSESPEDETVEKQIIDELQISASDAEEQKAPVASHSALTSAASASQQQFSRPAEKVQRAHSDQEESGAAVIDIPASSSFAIAARLSVDQAQSAIIGSIIEWCSQPEHVESLAAIASKYAQGEIIPPCAVVSQLPQGTLSAANDPFGADVLFEIHAASETEQQDEENGEGEPVVYFLAHKLNLAFRSQFFVNMFAHFQRLEDGGSDSSGGDPIEVLEKDSGAQYLIRTVAPNSNVFREILRFIYMGSCKPLVHELVPCMKLAAEFGLHQMSDILGAELITKVLQPENAAVLCNELMLAADSDPHLDMWVDEIVLFIGSHASQVFYGSPAKKLKPMQFPAVNLSSIRAFSEQNMTNLLSRMHSCNISEEHLCMALIEWARDKLQGTNAHEGSLAALNEANRQKLREMLAEPMRYIRICAIQMPFFEQVIDSIGLLDANEIAMCYKFFATKNSLRTDLDLQSSIPRNMNYMKKKGPYASYRLSFNLDELFAGDAEQQQQPQPPQPLTQDFFLGGLQWHLSLSGTHRGSDLSMSLQYRPGLMPVSNIKFSGTVRVMNVASGAACSNKGLSHKFSSKDVLSLSAMRLSANKLYNNDLLKDGSNLIIEVFFSSCRVEH